MFKMPNITTAAVFVTKELLQGERSQQLLRCIVGNLASSFQSLHT